MTEDHKVVRSIRTSRNFSFFSFQANSPFSVCFKTFLSIEFAASSRIGQEGLGTILEELLNSLFASLVRLLKVQVGQLSY